MMINIFTILMDIFLSTAGKCPHFHMVDKKYPCISCHPCLKLPSLSSLRVFVPSWFTSLSHLHGNPFVNLVKFSLANLEINKNTSFSAPLFSFVSFVSLAVESTFLSVRSVPSVVKVFAITVALTTSTFAADSDMIIFDPSTDFHPIQNTIRSAANGATITYFDPTNPNGVFHGVFEIKFKIRKNYHYDGRPFELYVKKQNNNWKKIAEVTPKYNRNSSIWEATCYWNSRSENFEWEEDDIEPFSTHLKLKIRLVNSI